MAIHNLLFIITHAELPRSYYLGAWCKRRIWGPGSMFKIFMAPVCSVAQGKLPLLPASLGSPGGIRIKHSMHNCMGGTITLSGHICMEKTTFLWSDSKNWGARGPLIPTFMSCIATYMYSRSFSVTYSYRF